MKPTTTTDTEISMAAFVAELKERANKAARRQGFADRAEQSRHEAARNISRRFSGAHYVGR